MPNTEIVTSVIAMEVENEVDKIIYYEYENSKAVDLMARIADDRSEFIFSAMDNDTVKNVFWEFTADGSVQSQGFNIQFVKKSMKSLLLTKLLL
uniref:CUB domain-containing protein n=1 Tax=Panagrolaimus sp. ES5 TaxID=591445 RepID=A0AC34G6Z0_9BILA